MSSIKQLEGLSVEYQVSTSAIFAHENQVINVYLFYVQVPFPLTYLFNPASIQAYSSVFVFLLQMRLARSAVESVFIRGVAGSTVSLRHVELKIFHALRSRFTWLIK